MTETAAQTTIRPDVLVVDDSSTIRRSAEIFLSQAGYSVLLAKDGFEALSSIVVQTPALIFCDILMPRLDGYQTCCLIRCSEQYHHIPLVLLSSRDGLFDRARGMLSGASAYLTKPFTKDSLIKTVVDLIPKVANG
jgi:twitching motility two-component system response regulator PilG